MRVHVTRALLLVFLFGCGGGNRGSIGVMAAHENATGRIVVKEVPEGLAGARAGLEVGDEIVAVDGRPVHDMTPAEFREAVRGEIGSHVKLVIRRNGLQMTVDVERGALKSP